MDGIERAAGVWAGGLEIRQRGDRPEIAGRFPYGDMATIADRGRVRKERFRPGAFRYSIAEANEGRTDINLLIGHSFDRPVASVGGGTLALAETRDAVEFTAALPVEADQPSWLRDLVLSIRSGLMLGLSPGFRIPPADAVADAIALVPEAGNPDVMIRDILAAVLYEFSIVTRGAYSGAGVDLRGIAAAYPSAAAGPERKARLWL